MKKVVITGSSRGIGFGLAEAFLERGCAVTISSRDRKNLQAAQARLSSQFSDEHLLAHPCDVRDPGQLQALWDASIEEFGHIDIWINNAGLANDLADFRCLQPEQISTIVETNILGTLFGSRVALNGMINQGFGALYNMEGHGSNGRKQDGLTLYGTTKAALRYFDDAIEMETEGTPVIVGSIMPGMIWTDMLHEQFATQPELLERSKGILNIITDRVETVAPWLVDRILANKENGVRISWLNRRKIIGRFLTAPLNKRQIVDQIEIPPLD